MKQAGSGFPKNANVENPSWNYKNPLSTRKLLKMDLFAGQWSISLPERSKALHENNYFKRLPQTPFAHMPKD